MRHFRGAAAFVVEGLREIGGIVVPVDPDLALVLVGVEGALAETRGIVSIYLTGADPVMGPLLYAEIFRRRLWWHFHPRNDTKWSKTLCDLVHSSRDLVPRTLARGIGVGGNRWCAATAVYEPPLKL